MSTRPDYCPVGNVPCQSLCEEPCTTRSSRLADEALMRTAAHLLTRYVSETPLGNQPHMITMEADAAITSLRARLETSNV